jgi:hypothetical protein
MQFQSLAPRYTSPPLDRVKPALTTRKRLFDAHQQMNHVEREFKCEECGHLFARQTQLATHRDSVHMGRKQELTVESTPANPHEVSIAEIKYKCK